jgi:hypothetical protein
MAAKSGVDDELFAMIWFGEFEEEDTLYPLHREYVRGCEKIKRGKERLTDERSYIFETRRPIMEVLSS